MNLEQFQKQRLEAYFMAHATDAQKSRRAERKLTIDGAYKWIESKLHRACENGEITPSASGVIVGDDEWCYAELMHYFTECEEGDTYHTEDEIKAEEAKQAADQAQRDEQAAEKRKEHAERVAKWQTMTQDAIREDIARTQYLRKHPWHKNLTAEELAQKREEALEAERKRKEAEAEREAKEAERKARLANAQMTFNI
jgi:hypothetical protein